MQAFFYIAQGTITIQTRIIVTETLTRQAERCVVSLSIESTTAANDKNHVSSLIGTTFETGNATIL